MKGAQERRNVEVGQYRVGPGVEVAMQLRLAVDLYLRGRQAVLGGEIGGVALGVGYYFQGAGRLPAQDKIAQVKPSQDGKGIKSAGRMGVELHRAGYREPWILRLREMS